MTEVQVEFLTLLAEGNTVKTTCRKTMIGERTLRRQIAGLCDRTGCYDRVHLIAWAIVHGYIRPTVPPKGAPLPQE